MESLILASASVRRQELLNQIGVRFTVRSQDIDETIHGGELADVYVRRMAKEKAESALMELRTCASGGDRIVLAADTCVVCDADILGKPADEEDAVAMLQQLSGREHRVLSAVTLATQQRLRTELSETRVRFREIGIEEAQRYYRGGEPEGKAGAYAIQGYGGVFVVQLIGSYSGVVGLPLFETAQLLLDFAAPNSIYQPPSIRALEK